MMRILLSFVLFLPFILFGQQSNPIAPPPPPPPPPSCGEKWVTTEKMPVFPYDTAFCDAKPADCQKQAIDTFVKTHLRYPTAAKSSAIEGLAIIRFIVKKDGSTSDYEIMRDPGGGCGAEALRIAKLMNEKAGSWQPGYYNNKPVNVYFNLPVKFSLQQ